MDDDADPVYRPALKISEIEITPEMIEAGVDELLPYIEVNSRDMFERVALGVFLAMSRASQVRL